MASCDDENWQDRPTDKPTDKHLIADASLVDGSAWAIAFTNKEIVERLFGNDVRPPIRGVTLKALTREGKPVTIYFSNTDNGAISVDFEN